MHNHLRQRSRAAPSTHTLPATSTTAQLPHPPSLEPRPHSLHRIQHQQHTSKPQPYPHPTITSARAPITYPAANKRASISTTLANHPWRSVYAPRHRVSEASDTHAYMRSGYWGHCRRAVICFTEAEHGGILAVHWRHGRLSYDTLTRADQGRIVALHCIAFSIRLELAILLAAQNQKEKKG